MGSHGAGFGNASSTKIFVGGLAWETPAAELRRYFQKYGEILEAVIITEKNTGRSKGYGFVTFLDPESARRSLTDPNPIIDGRRANCNFAAVGRYTSSLQRGQSQAAGRAYLAPSQSIGPPQMSSLIYPSQYGYMAYASDYGYQQMMMMHDPTSQSNGWASIYHYYQQYPQMNYRPTYLPPPSVFQAQAHCQPFDKNDPTVTIEAERSLFPPAFLPRGFQLQPPPHGRKSLTSSDSEAPTTLKTGGGDKISDA